MYMDHHPFDFMPGRFHVQAIATMVFLLGSAFFLWSNLHVSLVTFIGAFVAQANRAAAAAEGTLTDDSIVGCEGMFDENNINNDTLSIASGETFDLEMDEEWEDLLFHLYSPQLQQQPATNNDEPTTVDIVN